jgi:hypothetical protein
MEEGRRKGREKELRLRYSCRMASAGFAVAALTDWTLTVNNATAKTETEARRNGPTPEPAL